MKFSIIIATLNRHECIRNCINSVLNQKYRDYEIIIIDQSNNSLTEDIVNEYKSYDNNCIIYRKTHRKGISIARNEALSLVTGDFVCLLDDDAEYKTDFLLIACEILTKDKDIVILSGKVIDKNTKKTFLSGMNDDFSEKLTFKNLFMKFTSSSLIINSSELKIQQGFDENLGVGSKFGSAEEIDLILRINYFNDNIFYFPTLIVYHPYIDPIEIGSIKAYNYGKGFGALCKKHLIKYKNFKLMRKFIASIIRNLGGIVLNVFSSKIKFRHSLFVFRGRLEGFIKYYVKL